LVSLLCNVERSLIQKRRVPNGDTERAEEMSRREEILLDSIENDLVSCVIVFGC
jgi:hypothetical protein